MDFSYGQIANRKNVHPLRNIWFEISCV